MLRNITFSVLLLCAFAFAHVALAATPSVTLAITPSTIKNGEKFTVSWVGTGVHGCTGEIGVKWPAGYPASGTVTSEPFQGFPGTYPFYVTCYVDGTNFNANVGATASLTVTGPVIKDFKFTPDHVTVGTAANIDPDFTVSWSTEGANSCTAHFPGGLHDYLPNDYAESGSIYDDQSGRFPGESSFWKGEVGASGSKKLSFPKHAHPGDYDLGLTCTDADGTFTTEYERVHVDWVEGKPKTLALISPTTNTQWALGRAQSIRWASTWLPSSLKAYIVLGPPPQPISSPCWSGCKPTSPPPPTDESANYYIAHHIDNSGNFLWDGKTYFRRTHSGNCSPFNADASCFTQATGTIPAGTYSLSVVAYGWPRDIYYVDEFGNIILDDGNDGGSIISVVPFSTSTTITIVGSATTPSPTQSGTPVSTPAATTPITKSSSQTPSTNPVVTPTLYTPVQTPSTAKSSFTNPLPLTPKAPLVTAPKMNAPVSTVQDKPTTIPSSVSCPTFVKYLGFGSRDKAGANDVKNVQTFLAKRGYLKSAATGYFGSGTRTALRLFQKARGIQATGTTGPKTRSAMKAEACAQ